MGLTARTAVIFDLDGTLVLTEPRQRAVWRAFFDHNSVPVDDTLLHTLTGRRDRDSLPELGHLFPAKQLEELLAEITQFDAAIPLDDIDEVIGAVDFVHRLKRRGARMALVTSAKRAYALQVLDRITLADVFDAVVTAEDVTSGKPNPEGYLAACEVLGADPRAVIGFEDSRAGVEAVKAAGMYCVAVTTTFPAHLLDAADLVVKDFTDAAEIEREISGWG